MALPTGHVSGRLTSSVLFFVVLLLGIFCSSFALAQEAPVGQQQPKFQDPVPRRDIESGTSQGNIYIGSDSRGDQVMEVKPKPKKQDQQQQTGIGPILVVPQVGGRR